MVFCILLLTIMNANLVNSVIKVVNGDNTHIDASLDTQIYLLTDFTENEHDAVTKANDFLKSKSTHITAFRTEFASYLDAYKTIMCNSHRIAISAKMQDVNTCVITIAKFIGVVETTKTEQKYIDDTRACRDVLRAIRTGILVCATPLDTGISKHGLGYLEHETAYWTERIEYALRRLVDVSIV